MTLVFASIPIGILDSWIDVLPPDRLAARVKFFRRALNAGGGLPDIDQGLATACGLSLKRWLSIRNDPLFAGTLVFNQNRVDCPAALSALDHAANRSEAGRRAGLKSAEKRKMVDHHGIEIAQRKEVDFQPKQLKNNDLNPTYVELSDKYKNKAPTEPNNKNKSAALASSNASSMQPHDDFTTCYSYNEDDVFLRIEQGLLRADVDQAAIKHLLNVRDSREYIQKWWRGETDPDYPILDASTIFDTVIDTIIKKYSSFADNKPYYEFHSFKYFHEAVTECIIRTLLKSGVIDTVYMSCWYKPFILAKQKNENN